MSGGKIDEKFDVIFRGQIVKGKELAEVKNNLVSLFKSSLAAVEALFTGADIKIKKSLDYSTAMKYQSALKQAGALAIISEVVVVKAKANFMTAEDRVDEKSTASENRSEVVVSESSRAQADTSTVVKTDGAIASDSGMTMAEVGSRILPDKIYEKRNVDTGDLSLASVGERLLPPKAPESHPVPSIDHLALE